VSDVSGRQAYEPQVDSLYNGTKVVPATHQERKTLPTMFLLHALIVGVAAMALTAVAGLCACSPRPGSMGLWKNPAPFGVRWVG